MSEKPECIVAAIGVAFTCWVAMADGWDPRHNGEQVPYRAAMEDIVASIVH